MYFMNLKNKGACTYRRGCVYRRIATQGLRKKDMFDDVEVCGEDAFSYFFRCPTFFEVFLSFGGTKILISEKWLVHFLVA